MSVFKRFKRRQYAGANRPAEVNVLWARKVTKRESATYAIPADFCRIFEKNMNQLYLLSFLLTGDGRKAEECFVRGLEDSRKSCRVFEEWANSWARRTIILNAIQMVHPRPADSDASASSSDKTEGNATTQQAEIDAVVALGEFERFAFVMSVLEHYSHHECALLLGCTPGAVMAARISALRRIGKAAGHIPAGSGSGESGLRNESGSEFPLQAVSQLAVSA